MQNILIGTPHPACDAIALALTESCHHHRQIDLQSLQPEQGRCFIYAAPYRGSQMLPDLEDAKRFLETCGQWRPARVILLSSSLIFPAKHNHPGYVPESKAPSRRRSPLSDAWRDLEEAFSDHLRDLCPLAILRTVPVIHSSYGDFFSMLFRNKFAVRLAGHDPCLQFLTPAALHRGLQAMLARPECHGIFHLASDDAITLKAALKLAKTRGLPSPFWVNHLSRKFFASLGIAASSDLFERLRYNWTIEDRESRARLGIERLGRAGEAILETAGQPGDRPIPMCEPFGLDANYINWKIRTGFGFLHDHYFRVEYRGLEHIPKEGRGLMVGVHRGFMPIDGAMSLIAVLRQTRRHLRYLIHHSLVKPAGLFNFCFRMGGVIGDERNGDRLLQDDQLVGIFPEGIQGAFTFYRDAYKLGRFGRDAYVRLALRNQAPIIPFATVGSAEIYPIWGRIDMDWFKRLTEWPFLPITTPFPLPSKWHTQILEPIEIHKDYPPEAANDPMRVREIGQEVERRLQEALDQMRKERPGIFWGNIWD